MGAKETTVGGGGATPVANGWNNFLAQQLGQNPEQSANQGMLQSLMQMRAAMPSNMHGGTDRLDQQIASLQQQGQFGMMPNGSGMMSNSQGMTNSQGLDPAAIAADPEGYARWQQQAAQAGYNYNGQGQQMSNSQGMMSNSQGGTQFQQLFNNMASGGVNDPSGAFAQLQQMISGGGNTSERFSNPYQSQTYQNPNTQTLSTDLFSGQNGMANIGGIGREGNTNFDVMRGFGGQGGGTGFDSQLQSLIAQMQGGGGGGVGVGATTLDPARAIDGNSAEIQASNNWGEVMRQRAAADQRARFGAEGAGAMGTGAQFAEGTLNADYANRNAVSTNEFINRAQQQDLAERQAKAGVGLQSNAQGLQASMANASNSLQSSNSALSAMLSGRGQDLNQQIANRGMDVSQLGMGLNQAQGNQQAGIQQRGQDLSSMLQNQAQGNNFNLAATGQNQQNAQLNNQNALQSANQANGFNLSNASNLAQGQQGTNALNASQSNFDQNQLMQMIQMGLGQNNLGQGGQQQLMQMLFGAMGQSNALGTPQANTVMQQNPWMQLAQTGLGVAGNWMTGGMGGVGGGGGVPSLPPMGGAGGWQGMVNMTPNR